MSTAEEFDRPPKRIPLVEERIKVRVRRPKPLQGILNSCLSVHKAFLEDRDGYGISIRHLILIRS